MSPDIFSICFSWFWFTNPPLLIWNAGFLSCLELEMEWKMMVMVIETEVRERRGCQKGGLLREMQFLKPHVVSLFECWFSFLLISMILPITIFSQFYLFNIGSYNLRKKILVKSDGASNTTVAPSRIDRKAIQYPTSGTPYCKYCNCWTKVLIGDQQISHLLTLMLWSSKAKKGWCPKNSGNSRWALPSNIICWAYCC